MKHSLRYLVCGSLLLLTPWLFAETHNTTRQLDSIVAVVNNDVVMHSELDSRVNIIRQRLSEQNTSVPSTEILERQVLERLIVEQLQLQLADQQGIQVGEEALNDNLRMIAKQNNLSLSQFREVLEKENFDYAEFREEIRNEVIIGKLRRQMVENRVDVSKIEIEHELQNSQHVQDTNEYRIGHILIAVPEAATTTKTQEAQRRANEIVSQLREGADFKQLAVSESDGQQALEGGDLGWRNGAQLPTLFGNPVFSMQIGAIADPIRSPSGFHIITLLDRRGSERQMIEQVKVRHILIRPDELASEDKVKARLGQLKLRIDSNEDFSSLARSHSQDNVSAANGGDLGWVSPGEMVPQFEEVIFQLQVNSVSEPFVSRYGWHIAQVVDRRQFDGTQAIQRARAREFIRRRKVEEEWDLWLRRLRDEAYVEYRLEQ